jgi:hypothetical protein
MSRSTASYEKMAKKAREENSTREFFEGLSETCTCACNCALPRTSSQNGSTHSLSGAPPMVSRASRSQGLDRVTELADQVPDPIQLPGLEQAFVETGYNPEIELLLDTSHLPCLLRGEESDTSTSEELSDIGEVFGDEMSGSAVSYGTMAKKKVVKVNKTGSRAVLQRTSSNNRSARSLSVRPPAFSKAFSRASRQRSERASRSLGLDGVREVSEVDIKVPEPEGRELVKVPDLILLPGADGDAGGDGPDLSQKPDPLDKPGPLEEADPRDKSDPLEDAEAETARPGGGSFTLKEEEQMVDFFRTRGGFGQRGGNAVWQRMVAEGVCPGRSWQSLKKCFQRRLLGRGRLAEFQATEEALLAVGGGPDRDYTEQEDRAIIAFMARHGRWRAARGDAIWRTEAARTAMAGRSWTGARDRYLKVGRVVCSWIFPRASLQEGCQYLFEDSKASILFYHFHHKIRLLLLCRLPWYRTRMTAGDPGPAGAVRAAGEDGAPPERGRRLPELLAGATGGQGQSY